MKLFKKLLMLMIIVILLSGCVRSEDRKFRKYLENKYQLELAEKAHVDRCFNNCKYFGVYPLKNDLTYTVEVTDTYGEIDDSYTKYDKAAIEERQEIYKYIKEQKGDRFVPNYLIAKSASNRSLHLVVKPANDELSYIVYADDKMDFDKQLESDYRIILKNYSWAKNISIYYIDDERIKENNWLEELDIDANDYIYAPSYLDGDGELYTEKYKYYYSIDRTINDFEYTMPFEDFKKLVYNNLYKDGENIYKDKDKN